MKSLMKKFAVLASSAIMVAAMSATSFAANYNNAALETSETTLNIPKTLTVSNQNLASVDGPGLTYNYTIAPETPSTSNGGTSITDNTNTITVKAGPASGVTLTTASVSWPKGTAVNASSSGAANTKNIVAATDLTKFSQPGVYRYKITEAAAADPATLGVTDANAAEVRYLDVYIERDTTSGNLAVAGYVLHTGATSEGKPSTKTGFDASSFATYNIQVKVETGGTMGDRGNAFPVAGTVNDGGRYIYAAKDAAPTAVEGSKIAGAAAGSAVSTSLSHNQVYYISGLSSLATVAYEETNNTTDTYQVAITGGTASAASAVAPSAKKSMAETAVGSAATVTFTNTLSGISPTGLVFRYGPYIGMLALAVVLLIARRRTAEER